MNFRLPFQISRVSAICQSSSPVNLISKFTPIYGNHVKSSNRNKQNTAHHTWIITTKCTYRTIQSPFNIYQQKVFIHNIADTEEAVKQRVRREQLCDYQIPEEPKLAFRQTSKITCCKCIDYKPCIAPPLVSPPKLYDDSKCLYEHECNPDLCNINPPRKDDICCFEIEKKKLPRLSASLKCCPCMDYLKKPLIAPPLRPPTKYYDPEKMKINRGECEEPKCIRMDDVCNFKVVEKELPVLRPNNCKPCQAIRPLTAPSLRRPILRYDPTCIPYPHPNCPCDDDPLRRDSFVCEPILRELPPVPISNCMPCQPYIPTVSPVLKRPKSRYDPSEMKYKHKCPQSPCDTPSLRRDYNNNIISVTLTRKKLPPLRIDKTCKPCADYRPLTAPELKPPPVYNYNMNEEQKRDHCIQEKCIRRDGVIRICRKCLPPVPTSVCCKPCIDLFKPCTTPNFLPPQKLYDDSMCQYRHTCDPECCKQCPPRMDDTCYKDVPKELPKPPNSPDCKPCIEFPTTSPPICRLRKRYDDTKLIYKHPICPEDICKTTQRSDDLTGITDEVKSLQTYKPLKCQPCQQYVPCRAPVLHRPRARYDDTCMLYEHKNCPPTCDEAIYRRDHYVWEAPKRLPKVQCGTICEPCQQSYPCTAPPIGRPRKLYDFLQDPIRFRECPPECPPRRDDLLCWKPRKKKLPSFKDCDQCCCYSTFSWSNKKNMNSTMSSKCNFEKKLFPKIKSDLRPYFSTNPVSKHTKQSEKEKLSKACTSEPKPKHPSSTKTRYYVVKKPTWKSIDVSEDHKTNEKKPQKKYDYSIEKWLREGAEQIVKATSKSISSKRARDPFFNQFDTHPKYSTGPECITPVKFTGFDTSGFNEFCIKKNNKFQPLRVGSAFGPDNVSCNCDKTRIKSTMCVSRDVDINLNESKITTASTVPKESKKFTFTSIIQEHIKQQIPSTCSMPTSNFILKLNNKMRSALFQKISNFFKDREKDAKDRKILTAPKNVILERNDTKEFMANVCEKYDVQLDASKLKMGRNKPYIVQTFKNKGLKFNTNKSTMCCKSKTASKTDETMKTRTSPKKMKIKADQIRNFSTNSKGNKLYYKHIDISDDYIGKIYKVKLKKIGVKNLMLEKNDPDKREDEPHTICYICKVVPRYQPIIHDEPPDIENVKINYYKEKRNTIE